MSTKAQDYKDSYVRKYLESPVYVTVFNKTIETATTSYKISRILSIFLFGVGIILIISALILGFMDKELLLILFFGGLGTASIISLLLYRPIERIQEGVNELIKSQIACLSFMAQFDSIDRTLATWAQMPLKDTNRSEQLQYAKFLREAATQLINDLNQVKNAKSTGKTSKTEPDNK